MKIWTNFGWLFVSHFIGLKIQNGMFSPNTPVENLLRIK
jgi:hypothetical protein